MFMTSQWYFISTLINFQCLLHLQNQKRETNLIRSLWSLLSANITGKTNLELQLQMNQWSFKEWWRMLRVSSGFQRSQNQSSNAFMSNYLKMFLSKDPAGMLWWICQTCLILSCLCRNNIKLYMEWGENRLTFGWWMLYACSSWSQLSYLLTNRLSG